MNVEYCRRLVPTPAHRRYFFVHVMKTAGTTFVRSLREQFPGAAMYPSRGNDWHEPDDFEAYQSIARLLALPAERTEQIEMYTGHFPAYVCDQVDPALYTLTLLREPVARTVSVLKHFKRLDERYRSSPLTEIYADTDLSRMYIANHQTKIFSLTPDDGARSILRPIEIDDARLAAARENLAAIDAIGLTEHYGDFLEDLRAHQGWWPNGVDHDARMNSSPEAWDAGPDLRERIADDNYYDLRLYEHAKELIAARAAARPDS